MTRLLRRHSNILTLVLVLFVGLSGSYCSTGTVEKAALRTKVATLDSVYLADASGKLAAKVFDTNCPKNVLFTVDQCRGWRHFSEGKAPADPVCAAPSFVNLSDVYQNCGFRAAFPTAIRAYQENKESVTSIASAIDMMIRGARTQAEIAAGGK